MLILGLDTQFGDIYSNINGDFTMLNRIDREIEIMCELSGKILEISSPLVEMVEICAQLDWYFTCN